MLLPLLLIFPLLFQTATPISIGANTFDDIARKALRVLNRDRPRKTPRYHYKNYGSMSMGMDTITLEIVVERGGAEYKKEVKARETSEGRIEVLEVKNIDEPEENLRRGREEAEEEAFEIPGVDEVIELDPDEM